MRKLSKDYQRLIIRTGTGEHRQHVLAIILLYQELGHDHGRVWVARHARILARAIALLERGRRIA